MDTSKITCHNSQPTPSQIPARPIKQNPAGDHMFVMNTVDSMKNGQQRTSKRPTTTSTPSEVSSVDSNNTAKTAAKLPRLRPSKPVKNSGQVYEDIWIGILSVAEPKFLLEAKLISKRYRFLLKEYTTIWKDCRTNHYGSDMPDCPTGLAEKEYVELLAGRGCQSRKCSKTETQKVHWIFRGRLCTECLSEKTMRVCSSDVYT
jgi:hypothetical protein